MWETLTFKNGYIKWPETLATDCDEGYFPTWSTTHSHPCYWRSYTESSGQHQEGGKYYEVCTLNMPQSKKTAKLQSLCNPNPMTWCLHPKPNSCPSRRSLNFLTAFPLTRVELTCRILTSAPTIPSGPASSWAVIKIVVLFIAEYGSAGSLDKPG